MAVTVDLGAQGQAVSDLVRMSKGKWCEFIDKVTKAAYPLDTDPNRLDQHAGIRNAMAEARAMVVSFQSAVVLPVAGYAQASSELFLSSTIRNVATESAYRILFSGRSAAEVADMSRRYGQERHAMLAGEGGILAELRKGRIANDLAPDEWPALSARIQAPNGIWLVPLQSQREFQSEGKVMDHCVGKSTQTYSARAKDCSIHIVSARAMKEDGSMQSLSTAEFEGITSGSPSLQTLQHHGMSNSTPPKDALDAMDWYVSMVEAGQVAVNWEEIRAYLDDRLVDMDELERDCDYDWRDRDQIDAALGPWIRFFTKPFRKSFDEFVSTPEIRAIIVEFPPDFMLRPGQ